MRIAAILLVVSALGCVVSADQAQDVISSEPTEMHELFQYPRLALRPHNVLRRLDPPAVAAQQKEPFPPSPQVFPHQGEYPVQSPFSEQRSYMSEYPPQIPAETPLNAYESSTGAALPIGLVEWVGTNAAAFQNFFSGPREPNQNSPGSFLGELAKANLNFVMKEVPRLISEKISGPAPPLPSEFYAKQGLPQYGTPTSAGEPSYTYQIPAVANKPSRNLVHAPESYRGVIPRTQTLNLTEAWRQYQLQQQWLEELRSRLEKGKREEERKQLEPALPTVKASSETM